MNRYCYALLLAFSFMLQQGFAKQKEFAAFTAWTQEAKERFHQTKLANGLRVIHFQVPGAQSVLVGVGYGVGAKDEQPHQQGFAHMVEHMIFKGTAGEGALNLSEKDIWTMGTRYAQNFNAWTSHDQTVYYFLSDKQNYSVFVPVLADCMQYARFDDQHFASEVKAVLHEMKMHADPGQHELFKAIFPPAHPYYHEVLGNKELLTTATGADLKAFYCANYTPQRATFVCVGDVAWDEVLRLAERYFAPIPAPASVAPLYSEQVLAGCELAVQEAEQPFCLKRKIRFKKHPASPELGWVWRVPSILQRDSVITAHCVSFALRRRLEYLTSALQLVANGTVGCPSMQHGGLFFIEARFAEAAHFADKARVAQVRQLVQTELQKLAAQGLTPDEYEALKIDLLTSDPHAFETVAGAAHFIQKALVFDDVKAVLFEEPQEVLRHCSPQVVAKFCKTYLDPAKAILLVGSDVDEQELANWEAYEQALAKYDQELLARSDRTAPVEEERYAKTVPPPTALEVGIVTPDLEFVLDNGLRILVKHDPAIPFVYASLGYKNNGDALKRALHATGMQDAHGYATASLLSCHGAVVDGHRISAQELRKYFATYGAAAGTFEAQCPVDYVKPVWKRWVTMLSNPVCSKKILAYDKASMLEKMVLDAKEPGCLAWETLAKHMCTQDPYYRTLQDCMSGIQSLDKQGVLAAYHRFMAPHNMVLTVVGYVEPEAIRQLCQKTFGTWKARGDAVDIASYTSDAVLELQNPEHNIERVYTPHERAHLMGACYTTTRGTDDALCLAVINTVLSRRIFDIREQTGLFYGCGVELAPGTRWQTDLALVRMPVAYHNVDLMRGELAKLFDCTAQQGITHDEFLAAKVSLLNSIALAHESMGARMEDIASSATKGLPYAYYQQQAERIKALTLEQVQVAAARYLPACRWSWAIAGMMPAVQESHEAP